MSSPPGKSPVRLISEWTHLALVVLEGDLDADEDVELLDLAVQSAERSGKRVVVDLSGVTYLGSEAFNTLLMPLWRGRALPWLAGPLPRQLEQLLTVTGARQRFRVFPTLKEAAEAAGDSTPGRHPET
ncbi:STAS domain-containing protein (plasmid) [Streptomyces sp. BH-SS-21]|uniref:STAS domain-containing protein n=1 Tax=Streptomyces liliiviolaceus TaxID=2823109 RepID=A0A941BDD4_9ACTN|nr:STAS domain-containing protein [Streptomyces liliiviolaceus]MBQ0855687.1 STAS domain-containing protein [Streptomyces liliiviolaceus]